MSETSRRAVAEAYGKLGALGERERSEEHRLGLTVEFVERVAGGYRGKRVLDIGSSIGLHLLAAKERGAKQVVGLDKYIFPDAFDNDFILTNEEMTELQEVWKREGVTVLPQDLAGRWPFEDGSFDLVVCDAVIEHLHGIHKALFEEVRRVLAPGGMFVFTTPNLASLLKRVRFLFGRSPMWDFKDYVDSGLQFTGHVREFTVGECRSLLSWTGFDPLKVVARPSYFRWSWLKNPAKFHNVFFQAVSRVWPTWGDLVFAVGRKRD